MGGGGGCVNVLQFWQPTFYDNSFTRLSFVNELTTVTLKAVFVFQHHMWDTVFPWNMRSFMKNFVWI